MKLKTYFNVALLCLTVGLFSACTGDDLAATDKEKAKETPQGVKFTTSETKVSAKLRVAVNEDGTANAKTRTIIKHVPGQGADAFWAAGDKIWVQDKNGTWQQSTHTELHDNGASAEFTLPGTMADYADGCAVRYTGSFGTSNKVQITNYQVNYTPNDFSLGDSKGDCGVGVARATGNPVKFNFTLNHLVSYLCFIPRCTDAALGQNIQLTDINITATPAISGGNSALVGNFRFTADGQHIEGDNQLRNRTDLPVSNFPLTNTTDNYQLNACYAVVPPGNYNFTIRYGIIDKTNGVNGAITKFINNVVCDEGIINDFRVDLVPPRFSESSKYYMWDAQKDYWWGNYDKQPSVKYVWVYDGFPKSGAADPQRWYHENPVQASMPMQATESCRNCPNVNEMVWYAMKGKPHWDNGSGDFTWTSDGHLHKISSGMWLLKEEAIVRYLTDPSTPNHYPSTLTWNAMKEAYWGTPTASHDDLRTAPTTQATYSYGVIQGRPSETEINDYFFLPALGYYYPGFLWTPPMVQLTELGETGYYWSSSNANSGWVAAVYLTFSRTYIGLGSQSRAAGASVREFE